MKANSTKDKTNTEPMLEMSDTLLKNCEQAMKAGFKLQEEAGRWWNSMLQQPNLSEDWQKRFSNVSDLASSLVPLTQRRFEDFMSLMEKNSRAGAELMKKAVDAAQTPALNESQAKWVEFWTSSLGAVRSNAEAVTDISSKAIDSWIDFARKHSETCEAHASKAI